MSAYRSYNASINYLFYPASLLILCKHAVESCRFLYNTPGNCIRKERTNEFMPWFSLVFDEMCSGVEKESCDSLKDICSDGVTALPHGISGAYRSDFVG